MSQQQDTAAGNKAVRHIKDGKLHKFRLDHIHHIAEAESVNHIAGTTGVDGYNEPALQIREGPALFGPSNCCSNS